MKSFISKTIAALFSIAFLISCSNTNEKQKVTEEDYTATLSEDKIKKYCLAKGEIIPVCKKLI